MTARRTAIALAVAVAAAGLSATPLAPAQAAGCPVFFDVNGDGFDDLAVGAPGEDITVGAATRKDAGSVTIVFGSALGTFGNSGSRTFTQESVGLASEVGDRFGAAVATADLNGDTCGDLAIGLPGEDRGAGAVVVIWGSPSGLSDPPSAQVLQQGTQPLGGRPLPGDGFGTTLAPAGLAPSGGAAALWVGAPGKDVGRRADAGLVVQLNTSPGALLGTTGTATFHEDTAGVPGSARAGDRFGERLSGGARTLLIGIPRKDIGKAASAGSVLALTLSNGVWHGYNQNSAGIPGTAEAGDGFGGAVAHTAGCSGGTSETWAIGAPGEDIGAIRNTGTVTLRDRQSSAAISLSQGTLGLPGASEAGDRFGSALVDAGALVIGTPLEDIGVAPDAGAITLVDVGCTLAGGPAVDAARNWSQATGGVPDGTEPGDSFGRSLGASAVAVGLGPLQTRLVVGSPGESEGTVPRSGSVTVFGTDGQGLTTTGASWFGQVKIGQTPRAEDGFGGSLDAANALLL